MDFGFWTWKKERKPDASIGALCVYGEVTDAQSYLSLSCSSLLLMCN
jgi:hypothetical protein